MASSLHHLSERAWLARLVAADRGALSSRITPQRGFAHCCDAHDRRRSLASNHVRRGSRRGTKVVCPRPCFMSGIPPTTGTLLGAKGHSLECHLQTEMLAALDQRVLRHDGGAGAPGRLAADRDAPIE